MKQCEKGRQHSSSSTAGSTVVLTGGSRAQHGTAEPSKDTVALRHPQPSDLDAHKVTITGGKEHSEARPAAACLRLLPLQRSHHANTLCARGSQPLIIK